MAKLVVTYTTIITEIVDWPDNEMGFLNKESLVCNLEPQEQEHTNLEISYVKVDGKILDLDER